MPPRKNVGTSLCDVTNAGALPLGVAASEASCYSAIQSRGAAIFLQPTALAVG
ncbi:MAG: hypothetical protein K2L28_06960 [Muribaculaceae bacterium]|nr:hypothetical protein [Muribaculaceae bacterium]